MTQSIPASLALLLSFREDYYSYLSFLFRSLSKSQLLATMAGLRKLCSRAQKLGAGDFARSATICLPCGGGGGVFRVWFFLFLAN